MKYKSIIIIFITVVVLSLIIKEIVVYFINIWHILTFSVGKKMFKSINKDFIIDNNILSMPIYYINLERSQKRKKEIEKNFQQHGIKNYQRIKAFDGKDIKNLKSGEIDGTKYINKSDFFYIGPHELAITLSHIKAIKKSYDNGDNLSIILEDDANFSTYPLWKDSFNKILESMPKDTEILQLTSNNLNIENFELKIKKRPNDTSSYGCAGAYLMTKKGMEKIINNFFLEDGTVIFKENLKNPVIDYGVFNFMNIYYVKCNLFLLHSFSEEKNTYEAINSVRFIVKDYKTLKYLVSKNRTF